MLSPQVPVVRGVHQERVGEPVGTGEGSDDAADRLVEREEGAVLADPQLVEIVPTLRPQERYRAHVARLVRDVGFVVALRPPWRKSGEGDAVPCRRDGRLVRGPRREVEEQ